MEIVSIVIAFKSRNYEYRHLGWDTNKNTDQVENSIDISGLDSTDSYEMYSQETDANDGYDDTWSDSPVFDKSTFNYNLDDILYLLYGDYNTDELTRIIGVEPSVKKPDMILYSGTGDFYGVPGDVEFYVDSQIMKDSFPWLKLEDSFSGVWKFSSHKLSDDLVNQFISYEGLVLFEKTEYDDEYVYLYNWNDDLFLLIYPNSDGYGNSVCCMRYDEILEIDEGIQN